MPSGYTEDRSVEQPAIDLFQQLNWETYNACNEVLGEEGVLSCEKTELIGRNPLSERGQTAKRSA